MPNTDSVERLLDTVRTALLTFVPLAHPVGGTATLAARLGSTTSGAGSDGKLYIDAPPDPITYPYGILRLASSFPSGDDGGFQFRGEIEVQLFGYPRDQAQAISAMADLVEQCWRDFVRTAVDDTIVAKKIAIRNTVPFGEPADRELVLVRLLLPFYATPYYQAQYSTAVRL